MQGFKLVRGGEVVCCSCYKQHRFLEHKLRCARCNTFCRNTTSLFQWKQAGTQYTVCKNPVYVFLLAYLRPERRDAEYQEDQGNCHVVQQLESFGTAVVDAQQEYIQLHAKPRASADSPISATTGKHNHVRVCCMQPSYKYPFGSFISWCSAVFKMPYSMT